MKESVLYVKLKQWLPKGAFSYKTHDTLTRGVPDFYVQYAGHAVWIEVKENHKLTGIQYSNLLDLKKQGAIALVMKNTRIGDVSLFDMEKQAFKSEVFDITTHNFEEVINGTNR